MCIHCQGGKPKRSEIPERSQNRKLFCLPSVEVNRAAAKRITGKDTLIQRVLLHFPDIYTAIPPPRHSTNEKQRFSDRRERDAYYVKA